MGKNNAITQRLNELVAIKGTNANRLSKDVGGTTTKYYKLLDGSTVPNWETIASILEFYSDISAEWLIRGEGPIFRQKVPDIQSIIEENSNLKVEVKVLKNMYEDLVKNGLRGK